MHPGHKTWDMNHSIQIHVATVTVVDKMSSHVSGHSDEWSENVSSQTVCIREPIQ